MVNIDEEISEFFEQVKNDEYDMAVEEFTKILDDREQKFKNGIKILHKRIDQIQEKGVKKHTPLPREKVDTIKIDYYEELRKQFVNKYRKG